jgi:hypothetical protein
VKLRTLLFRCFATAGVLPCLLTITVAPAFGRQGASDDDPIQLLAQVRRAYRVAPAYRSEGTVTSHIIDPDKGTETTLSGDFTMQLGRPRLYRITWSQEVEPLPAQVGAVWNAGEGPRLLLNGPGTCSTMTDDRLALAAATGVSMGAANFIPHLFFDLGENTDPLDRLSDVVRETEGEVDGRTCHILRGTMSDTITVRMWIDQETLEIHRIESSFSGAPTMKMSAEDEARALKSMGSELTEENRQRLRQAMAQARKSLGNVRGKTSQEHKRIDLIGVPDPASFEVALPEDVKVIEGPMMNAPAASAREEAP